MKGLTTPRRKQVGSAAPATPDSLQRNTTARSESAILDENHPAVPTAEHGFLGSTAYNAPFADNESHFPLRDDSESDGPDFGEKLHEQITAKQRGTYRMDYRIKEAIRVLEFLRQFEDLENMMQHAGHEAISGIMGFFVDRCMKSVRKDIHEAGSLKDEKSMTEMIHRLFENTAKPVILRSDINFDEFMCQFVAENIRWETLAVVLIVCGLAVGDMYTDSRVLKFVENTEAGRLSLQFNLAETSNACVTFCDELGCMNDLYMILLVENCVLASQAWGDGHHLVWRKVGDMSTAVFASGIHQQNHPNLPFWLREVRRRCLGTAYALDKSLCMFLGRPPRIARQYCVIDVPLDLEDDELLLEGEALQACLKKLGPDGWKVNPKDSDSNWTRPFLIQALVREEVLEISLGPPQANLRERALDIIRRNHEVYVSLPMSIDTPPDLWASREISPSWHAVNRYLECRYNEFLILRTMVRQLHDDPNELLILSHTILTAIIEVRNMRAVLPTRLNCMAWLAVLFGLPPAGVLALELLQLNSKELCHVKIAQDLCVFISFLRWIHVPGEGNFQLVDRARRTLQRFLDKYMAATCRNGSQKPSSVAKEPISTAVQEQALWPDAIGVNDFFWMDNLQWEPEMWPNTNILEMSTAA